MKYITDEDSLKLCRDSHLLILNLGRGERVSVFESLKEEKAYTGLWNEKNPVEQMKNLVNEATHTDKFFAVIGTRRVNIHDDYEYCHAMFDNFENAKHYAEENQIKEARIYNEKGNLLENLSQKLNDFSQEKE